MHAGALGGFEVQVRLNRLRRIHVDALHEPAFVPTHERASGAHQPAALIVLASTRSVFRLTAHYVRRPPLLPSRCGLRSVAFYESPLHRSRLITLQFGGASTAGRRIAAETP
jgi:hypothetical protein